MLHIAFALLSTSYSIRENRILQLDLKTPALTSVKSDVKKIDEQRVVCVQAFKN
uniref:Uncharacterized protein n=1 Tax=viral metagenome TaxID=1070528 RepID=A0A6C0KDB5_9ZZZZ